MKHRNKQPHICAAQLFFALLDSICALGRAMYKKDDSLRNETLNRVFPLPLKVTALSKATFFVLLVSVEVQLTVVSYAIIFMEVE